MQLQKQPTRIAQYLTCFVSSPKRCGLCFTVPTHRTRYVCFRSRGAIIHMCGSFSIRMHRISLKWCWYRELLLYLAHWRSFYYFLENSNINKYENKQLLSDQYVSSNVKINNVVQSCMSGIFNTFSSILYSSLFQKKFYSECQIMKNFLYQ